MTLCSRPAASEQSLGIFGAHLIKIFKISTKSYIFILFCYEVSEENFLPFRFAENPDRNCTSLEHRCSDGTCLSFTSRCNFVAECPNGDYSDEQGCGELWL